jgi:dolichol-phosphate mannosyltransferase
LVRDGTAIVAGACRKRARAIPWPPWKPYRATSFPRGISSEGDLLSTSFVGQADQADQADEATNTATSIAMWVVLPTYNEMENLPGISRAILAALPTASLLVVDDNSPDGTGQLADELAANDPRIRVRHRVAKEGLGPAYLDGFGVALAGGADLIVQMDADGSHDPAALPSLVQPIVRGDADLVIGSRYTAGGHVEDWPASRRLISRSGSLFARIVLGLQQQDLTGGFKAWRASTLRAIPSEGINAGGYVFQIEMTYRATQSGARVIEVPITFRDRLLGKSKMSRRIIVEALVIVIQLRLSSFRRTPSPARSTPPGPTSAHPQADE